MPSPLSLPSGLAAFLRRLTALLPCLLLLAACSPGDDDDDVDTTWQDANIAFFNAEAVRTNADGTPYYTVVTPPWNTTTSVLIHWFNDRELTQGNLSPRYNSSITVKYAGYLCEGTNFDSSYSLTDSLYTTRLNACIEGWCVALPKMHVGDSVRVVIPADLAYGDSGSGTSIPGASTLVFGIKLVDIPAYEIP